MWVNVRWRPSGVVEHDSSESMARKGEGGGGIKISSCEEKPILKSIERQQYLPCQSTVREGEKNNGRF